MQNSVHRKAINKRNNIDDTVASTETEAYTLNKFDITQHPRRFYEIQTVKENNTDDPVSATETETSTSNKYGNKAKLSFPVLHMP